MFDFYFATIAKREEEQKKLKESAFKCLIYSPYVFIRCIHFLDMRYWYQTDVNCEWSVQGKKISNDQELIQSDPISCPQNQKGNN